MKRIFIVLLFGFMLIVSASAQFNIAWQGKKCAVVLTYDDAVNQHLDNAIPALDSLGLKATFYINAMKDDFVAARAVRNEMHKINEIDLYNVDCYVVNGETGAQMIEWVKKAIETNSLLVILFHGVDGGNSLNVSLPAHSQLLHFLKENEKDIMIAPMITVAEHIKTWQANDKAAKIIQQGTQADYKNMLAQLHIDSTRRGTSANLSAPNAANSDE